MEKRESLTALGPLETTSHQRSIIKLSSSSSQGFITEIKAALKDLSLLAFPHLWAGLTLQRAIHTVLEREQITKGRLQGRMTPLVGEGRA